MENPIKMDDLGVPIFGNTHMLLPTLPETNINSTWKLMVGGFFVPFWGVKRPIFRGELAVSFREGKWWIFFLGGKLGGENSFNPSLVGPVGGDSTQIPLSQWLNFKLFGITYLVGKIKFKLFFSGSIGWVRDCFFDMFFVKMKPFWRCFFLDLGGFKHFFDMFTPNLGEMMIPNVTTNAVVFFRFGLVDSTTVIMRMDGRRMKGTTK